jgi:5-methylcytosine-specific restriction endonuclease McrA
VEERAKGLARHYANRDARLAYNKVWRAKNREYVKACKKAWDDANREHVQAQSRAYYHANPDACQAKSRAYKAANRPHMAELQARRRRASKKATLPTSSPEAMRAIYERAALLTVITGVPHEVDHIVPLQGRNVCGLHVWWNMRAIPAVDNRSKKDRF